MGGGKKSAVKTSNSTGELCRGEKKTGRWGGQIYVSKKDQEEKSEYGVTCRSNYC